jgi:hypothetical protein
MRRHRRFCTNGGRGKIKVSLVGAGERDGDGRDRSLLLAWCVVIPLR